MISPPAVACQLVGALLGLEGTGVMSVFSGLKIAWVQNPRMALALSVILDRSSAFLVGLL